MPINDLNHAPSSPTPAPTSTGADDRSTTFRPVEGGTEMQSGEKLDIAFAFATDTLPHLQIWHDFRPHACVLGIEPCTSARALIPGLEKTLKPDETRRFELSISFATG